MSWTPRHRRKLLGRLIFPINAHASRLRVLQGRAVVLSFKASDSFQSRIG